MSDVAIRVENLSKLYRIGSGSPNRTFREMLTDTVTAPFRGVGRNGNGRKKDFWALKDVSFEVKVGEAVGVIGHNGAGKSTLLKILSRITEPTHGTAKVQGRIGALLEVGAGFHPELTGRENVYLNGAILGLTRKEIEARFDDIIEFAGVSRFVDTAVKHYSSGMYVRLAFAVAAYVKPDILIVDEVLAVGDANFQLKCIEHFQDMRKEGHALLFISHNLQLIQDVCDRTILLENGAIAEMGYPATVVEAYTDRRSTAGTQLIDQANLQVNDPLRWGNGHAAISAVYTCGDGQVTRQFQSQNSIDIVIEFNVLTDLDEVVVGLAVSNSMGWPIFSTNSQGLKIKMQNLKAGSARRATFSIDNVFGDDFYTISCAINNRDRTQPYCRAEGVHTFQVSGRSKRFSPLYPNHELTLHHL